MQHEGYNGNRSAEGWYEKGRKSYEAVSGKVPKGEEQEEDKSKSYMEKGNRGKGVSGTVFHEEEVPCQKDKEEKCSKEDGDHQQTEKEENLLFQSEGV